MSDDSGYVDRVLEKGVDTVEAIPNPEARSFTRGFLSLDYANVAAGLYEAFGLGEFPEDQNISVAEKVSHSETTERDFKTPIVNQEGNYLPDRQSRAYLAGSIAGFAPLAATFATGDAGLLAPTAAVSGASLANYTERYLNEE